MTTGYTAAVMEGKATFGQFVWHCARAFGALIEMREEPKEAPIPVFEPSPYYLEQKKQNEKELARLEAMGPAALERHVDGLRRETRLENAKRAAEHAQKLQRYESMLAQVRDWTPPTPDHEGLRKFMTEQLTSSIEFDCGSGPYVSQEIEDANAWREKRAEALRDSIRRSEERYQEEVTGVATRNDWVASLKASVPYEKP